MISSRSARPSRLHPLRNWMMAALLLALAVLLFGVLPNLTYAEPLLQGAAATSTVTASWTPTPLRAATSGGTYTMIDSDAEAHAQFSALEIDSNGNPVLLYQDYGLRIVRCQDIACTNRTTVLASMGNIVVMGAVLDSQDRVVFAYLDGMNLAPLNIGRCLDLDCISFTSLQIDGGLIWNSAFDDLMDISSSDLPSVAYLRFGPTPSGLQIARCETSACSQANQESLMQFDTTMISIQLDSNDIPVIAYTTQTALRLLRCTSASSCTGASSQLVAPLQLISYAPFSMTLNPQNLPRILFFDPTGLAVAECADAGCTANTVIRVIDPLPPNTPPGFSMGGIALGPNDEQFIAYDRTDVGDGNHYFTYLFAQRCLNGVCSGRNLDFLSERIAPLGGFADVEYSNGTWLISYYDGRGSYNYNIGNGVPRLWLFSEAGSYPTPTPSFTPSITLTPSATLTPSRTFTPFATLTPTITASSPPIGAPQRNRFTVAHVLLTWNPISSASSYEVQVAVDAAFQQIVYTASNLPPNELQVTTSLLADGLYYWRVRGQRAGGGLSAWSAVDTFYVQVATNTPIP